ncbi:MAG: hypothetical protein HDR73_02960 [Clavibacter sp.]|nr:hypothetical protein [Clavibacter sp.]
MVELNSSIKPGGLFTRPEVSPTSWPSTARRSRPGGHARSTTVRRSASRDARRQAGAKP